MAVDQVDIRDRGQHVLADSFAGFRGPVRRLGCNDFIIQTGSFQNLFKPVLTLLDHGKARRAFDNADFDLAVFRQQFKRQTTSHAARFYVI